MSLEALQTILEKLSMAECPSCNGYRRQEEKKCPKCADSLGKAIVLNENVPGTELNTAEYSQDAMAAKDNPNLIMLEMMIDNLKLGNFGSEPGEFMLGNTNKLCLSKVDDGCYSGWVKNETADIILRLEKMTIPSILQALEAKKLIDDSFAPKSAIAPELRQIAPIATQPNSIATVVGEHVIDMVNQHKKDWEGQEGSRKEEKADEELAERIEDVVAMANNEGSEREELTEVLDALRSFQAKEIHIHLHKSLLEIEDALVKTGDLKSKGGHPVGTVREHEGKKYQKFADGHWVEHKQENPEEAAEEAAETATQEAEEKHAQEQQAQQIEDNAKKLEELEARAQKMAEQRAKERGRPLQDTPAKLKKDLNKVKKDHKATESSKS